MTTVIDERIKSLYENEKLSPEQIAEEEGFNLIAVKAKLMQVSVSYRRDCKAEPEEVDELNFGKHEQREVREIIMDIARSAENSDGTVDYRTRLNAATYVRDDSKGRKDAKAFLTGNQFNIFSFNEKLAAVSERTKKMKELVEV